LSPRFLAFVLFAALVRVAPDSGAKTDPKFARWLGRTTVEVLEAADRV